MDLYILKLSGVDMAYPKGASYSTIYCAHASTNQGTLRLQQPQGCGDTPVFPSNFSLSLMTLELNMWGKKHAHRLLRVLQEYYEISED